MPSANKVTAQEYQQQEIGTAECDTTTPKTHIWAGSSGVGKLEKAIKSAISLLDSSYKALTPQAEMSCFLSLCKEGKAMLIQAHSGLTYHEVVGRQVATETQVYYTEGDLLRAIRAASQLKSAFVMIVNSAEQCDLSSLLGPLYRGLLNRNIEEPIWLESQQDYLLIPSNFYFFCTFDTSIKPITQLNITSWVTQLLPNTMVLSPQSLILRLWRRFNDSPQNNYEEKERRLYSFLGVSEKLRATQDEIYNQMAAQFNKTGVWSVRAFAEHGINEEDFSGVRLDKLLKGLNQRILKHLGAENLIGHHFFINIDSQQELSLLFGKKILPRLQILFYNEPHYLQAILKNEGEELPFLIPVEEGIPIVNAWSLQVNPKLLAGDFTQKDFEGLY